MARIKCSCGGPIVSGEGWEVCVVCSETRRMGMARRSVDCFEGEHEHCLPFEDCHCDCHVDDQDIDSLTGTADDQRPDIDAIAEAWRETSAADSAAREAAAAVMEMGREPFEEAP